ncbi:pentatricopeptide repeat-containing protein, chloroplastic [Cocos nucifera]|uniref:Pentatricopeptide repeat-containing protein, chloroplastic n=1 Tax=Cocos nucifera TaxID=13894 RepID=A0A8K0IRP8_COCNU|nr:pentatricopeptide repeat-containing protein, chloroplastic [Cocos nucifera]
MEVNHPPSLGHLTSDRRIPRDSFSFSCSSIGFQTLKHKKFKSFHGFDNLFARKKISSSSVKCSSVPEQGLKPKPRRNPQPIVEKPDPEPYSYDAHFAFSGASGLCSQIEKLVFFKRYEEALELFEVLRSKSSFVIGASTYDSLVNACINLGSVRAVKTVFLHMIESGFELDQYMRNRVLLMHLKCGMLADARRLFDEMPERNIVSWNTMITGLVDSGSYEEAFDLFLLMWGETSGVGPRMFATIIRASAGLGSASVGEQLHSCVLKMGLYGNIFISCSLIDMYSKCGCIEEAQWVFDEMPEKTIVGWNSIIAGYALHGYGEKALDMYYGMQSSGVKMDHFTYSIVIRICARLGSLEHAKQAHAGLVRNGFGLDIIANTTLVDFYCKWGRMEDAKNVFDMMPRKNVISWNALIGGYAKQGMGHNAVEMFESMVKEGMIPNHVTFLAVLSACSCSGLLDKGIEIFESMGRDPRMKPRAMHHACMIELLGRKGLLDEAFAMIKSAPFSPTKNMWAALLTACRIHRNLELGKFAAEKLFGMEPEKLSNYIVLLNIYNSSRRVDDAARVLEALKRKGLRLLPACSWIEIKREAHLFLFGDRSHPRSVEIYRKLDALMEEMVELGYAPDGNKPLLPDVGEHEQQISNYHSEKLAIAFGLISTPDSTPLQIIQGHRVCTDCHSVIKLITVVTKREIVMRDASRFHHFRNGTCSCGDYW